MPVRPLNTDRLTPWHLAAAALMACVGVAVTFEAWADLFAHAARDEEYSHIFLVPVVAAWLAYARRMRFRRCRHEGTWIGPLLLAAGWAIHWYGFNHGTQSFWHAGAVLVAVGCVIAVLGRGVLFGFLPAVVVLAFLVPLPGQIRLAIAGPLQTGIARIAQVLLEIFGTETTLSGNSLSINGREVMIAEACNGMRMVFPLILITFAFAYGLPLRNGVRLLLLALSPVVAIVANVLRTLPTIWIYGNASEAVFNAFHDYSGWAMLPIAFLVLLGVLKTLRWAMLPVQRYTLAGQ